MTNPDLVIMLARQRSGTNPLRDVLATHEDIFTTPEVFHGEPSADAELECEMNFYNFLEQHPKATIRRTLSIETQEQIFLDYLEFLRSFSDKPYVIVDVKLNSTHHLDGPWRSPGEHPSLFTFIEKHRLRVLHLTRRNYLRYYLSWRKANLTNAWTSYETGAEDPRVELNTYALLWALELCRSEDEITQKLFGRMRTYLTFDYDDMFPELGAPISQDVLDQLTAWLGTETVFPSTTSRFRKQSALGLRETIKNYEEVEQALQGTGFEYCLEDERMYRPAKPTPRRRRKAVTR